AGLVFIAFGFFIVIWRRELAPHSFGGRIGSATLGLSIILPAAFTVFVISVSLLPYLNGRAALEKGNYLTVEGELANFVPASAITKYQESFVVNGVRFAYSDYIDSSGLRRSSLQGITLHDGLPVRVLYSNNTILRLEIAR